MNDGRVKTDGKGGNADVVLTEAEREKTLLPVLRVIGNAPLLPHYPLR